MTQLRAMGVPQLVMLSGDIEETARVVAQAVGLKDWRAQLSPEQKYDLIRELRARGRRVAMVGDGINDAPALALADVGIAFGAFGMLNPFLAAILHNLSTLLVVLNSARLIRYDPDKPVRLQSS
jgi:P-type E1-E2 ATPase